jgi:hypothetical protein
LVDRKISIQEEGEGCTRTLEELSVGPNTKSLKLATRAQSNQQKFSDLIFFVKKSENFRPTHFVRKER